LQPKIASKAIAPNVISITGTNGIKNVIKPDRMQNRNFIGPSLISSRK